MYLSLIALCPLVVVGIYFYNNPLRHSGWFMTRRFINWVGAEMADSLLRREFL